MVVATSSRPRSCWIVRMSDREPTRGVTNECHGVWGLTGFGGGARVFLKGGRPGAAVTGACGGRGKGDGQNGRDFVKPVVVSPARAENAAWNDGFAADG